MSGLTAREAAWELDCYQRAWRGLSLLKPGQQVIVAETLWAKASEGTRRLLADGWSRTDEAQRGAIPGGQVEAYMLTRYAADAFDDLRVADPEPVADGAMWAFPMLTRDGHRLDGRLVVSDGPRFDMVEV